MRLSAQLLMRTGTPHRFLRWRSDVVRTMPREALPYLLLTPRNGVGPEFLTPDAGSASFDDGVDEVLATPTHRLKADLGELTVPPGIARWVEDLAGGSPQASELLRRSMVAYHRHVVAPLWDRVCRAVAGDLTLRAREMATGGIERTLSTLHPGIELGRSVLAVHGCPGDRQLDLCGSGLVIRPAYFLPGGPVFRAGRPDGGTLVIPAAYDVAAGQDRGEALGALLGRTRAAVLRAIQSAAPTTSALARMLAITPASASEHASVLRAAGLITSDRDGRRVIHRVTALGSSLLPEARTAGGVPRDETPARTGSLPRDGRSVVPVACGS
ncbi:winged helix-turn-helix domain-containing protein [Myceligenerans crystallogenes]